jgi:hypothetical protein
MRHRFAVVLDTYRRDKIDMFFDSSLALLVVSALCQIIRYNQLSMRMAGGAIGAIVQTEWWSSVGGPSPYHDSYTISFYTANDHSSEFRQAIEDLCLAAGASITGFYREEQAKQPYSYLPWWKKAWDWIASL